MNKKAKKKFQADFKAFVKKQKFKKAIFVGYDCGEEFIYCNEKCDAFDLIGWARYLEMIGEQPMREHQGYITYAINLSDGETMKWNGAK